MPGTNALAYWVSSEPTQVDHFSGAPLGVGSWPYSHTLDKAEKAFQVKTI
jgi:hypothetical protein